MTVWDDIFSNPSNLRYIIRSQAAGDPALFKQAASLIQKASRVIFAGVGSGQRRGYREVERVFSRQFSV